MYSDPVIWLDQLEESEVVDVLITNQLYRWQDDHARSWEKLSYRRIWAAGRQHELIWIA